MISLGWDPIHSDWCPYKKKRFGHSYKGKTMWGYREKTKIEKKKTCCHFDLRYLVSRIVRQLCCLNCQPVVLCHDRQVKEDSQNATCVSPRAWDISPCSFSTCPWPGVSPYHPGSVPWTWCVSSSTFSFATTSKFTDRCLFSNSPLLSILDIASFSFFFKLTLAVRHWVHFIAIPRPLLNWVVSACGTSAWLEEYGND